jgi:hypothetical protein
MAEKKSMEIMSMKTKMTMKRWIRRTLLVAAALVVAGGMAASAQSAPASGVQATSLALGRPHGVAYDTAGNIYIADTDENVIRKVNASGIITTVAGDGEQGYGGDGGLATAALLDSPAGVALDASGNLYIADTHNNVVREVVAASGNIATIAGTGAAGFSGDGAAATLATLNYPTAVAVDSLGNVYIADTNNHRIREITGTTINTVAGDGEQFFSGDSGPATAAGLDSPNGVAVDAAFNLYIGDTHNQRVRMVTYATGNISTLAGTGEKGFSGDGYGPSEALARPRGVAVDSSGGVYLADSDNQRIRSIIGGNLTTIAGSGAEGFSGDGNLATSAWLDTPGAVAVSGAKVLFSDTENDRIRQLSGGETYTLAGLLSPSTPGTLYSPAPGSILSTSSVTFNWTTGTGANAYQLCVGDLYAGGNCNLYASGIITTLSANVTGIPVYGENLFVRLWSRIGNTWISTDYTYTAAGAPVAAALTSPTPGTALTSSSVTFQWTAGSGITGYLLMLGTGKGAHDLYNGAPTLATSVGVTGLPTSGGTVYARLFSRFNGSWSYYSDSTYLLTPPATITTPAAGSTFSSNSVAFIWAPVSGATGYTLWLGSTGVGSGNLYVGHTTGSTLTANGLPINGTTIYARLYTSFSGSTTYTDSTFTAVSGATLTSPTPGSTFTGSSMTFTWPPVAGAYGYTLWLGTTPGSGNLYDGHTTTTNTLTATNLPLNGETIYARLYTTINGVTTYTDATYIAK